MNPLIEQFSLQEFFSTDTKNSYFYPQKLCNNLIDAVNTIQEQCSANNKSYNENELEIINLFLTNIPQYRVHQYTIMNTHIQKILENIALQDKNKETKLYNSNIMYVILKIEELQNIHLTSTYLKKLSLKNRIKTTELLINSKIKVADNKSLEQKIPLYLVEILDCFKITYENTVLKPKANKHNISSISPKITELYYSKYHTNGKITQKELLYNFHYCLQNYSFSNNNVPEELSLFINTFFDSDIPNIYFKNRKNIEKSVKDFFIYFNPNSIYREKIEQLLELPIIHKHIDALKHQQFIHKVDTVIKENTNTESHNPMPLVTKKKKLKI